jgi:hypothetical protein
MKNQLNLKNYGPWAIITGSSSGIGKEFAEQLANMKFNLVLVARRKELLEEIGKYLSDQYGINYLTLQSDLAKAGSVKSIIEQTKELDIGLLISNAGAGKPGRFLDVEEEQLLKTVQLNTISHISLVHYFAKNFEKRGNGGIILTGAMGASEGIPYMANEAGTKAYVKAFGLSLHSEFKNKGIHVTVLETSPTSTPVFNDLGLKKSDFPLKPLTTKKCVSETLLALKNNRAVIIPGRKYRLMNTLVPSSISRSMMGRTFKKSQKL